MIEARVFSFKLELWSMAAAAQDGRTDGPHKNPIQPSRGCTVLYVRCAESTVGRCRTPVGIMDKLSGNDGALLVTLVVISWFQDYDANC